MAIQLEQGDLTIRYMPEVDDLNHDAFVFYIEQGEDLIILTRPAAERLAKNIQVLIGEN